MDDAREPDAPDDTDPCAVDYEGMVEEAWAAYLDATDPKEEVRP